MITTAILCGGRGSRLGPITDEIPKPLVPLHGKPVLFHSLNYYIARGFRHFVLCLGYRGYMIREQVLQAGFDAEFEFSDAGEDASMLQRLHACRALLNERSFVVYGDTLVTVDLQQMLNDHLRHKPLMTMTTGDIRSPFGLVTSCGDGWANSFEEKPVLSYYIGHFLLETSVLDCLDQELLDSPDGVGIVRVFHQLIAQKQVRVLTHHGPQITFNTRQELDQAERELVAFFTHFE